MRIAVLLALLFLVVPFSAALEVKEFQFYSQGEALGAISSHPAVQGGIDLKITVFGPDFQRVRADISKLNKNQYYVQMYGYKDITVHKPECFNKANTSDYECYIRNIALDLASPTVTIPIKLHGNVTTEINKTYTFSIDDTAPEAISIAPEGCIKAPCYIRANKLTKIVINFQDTKATFNKGMVQFSIGTKNMMVDNCTGMTCYGRNKASCGTGDQIQLKVNKARSMDDAYNLVKNSLTSTAICDADPPKLLNLTIKPTSGLDIIKSGDTLDITVDMEDVLNATPKVTANLTEIGIDTTKTFDQCVIYDSHWRCKTSVNVQRGGPYTAKLHFKLIDAVGNEEETTKTIQVLGVDETEKPDFWKVGSVQQSPTRVSKNHMFFPRDITIGVLMQPKKPEVSILDVTNDPNQVSCIPYPSYSRAPILSDIKLVNDYSGIKNLYITAKLPQGEEKYANMTKVVYNCSFSFITKRGDYAIKNTETESFDVTIEFDRLKSMKQLLKEEEEAVLKEQTALQKTINDVATTLNVLTSICGVITKVKTASSILGGATTATSWMASSGTVLSGINAGLTTANDGVNAVTDVASKGLSAIMPVCDIIGCRAEWQEDIKETIKDTMSFGAGDALDTMAQVGGYANYSQALNPYDNPVIAISTLCFPAIVTNVQRYNNINCEYTRCLREDVELRNLDINECKRAKSYGTCTYFAGAVFDIFPWTSMAKVVARTWQGIVSNPLSFFTSGGMGILCGIGWWPDTVIMALKGTCNIHKAFKGILQFWGWIEQLKQPLRLDVGSDFCNDVQNAIDPESGRWIGMPNSPDSVTNTLSYTKEDSPFGYAMNCDYRTGCKFDNSDYRIKVVGVQNGQKIRAQNLEFITPDGRHLNGVTVQAMINAMKRAGRVTGSGVSSTDTDIKIELQNIFLDPSVPFLFDNLKATSASIGGGDPSDDLVKSTFSDLGTPIDLLATQDFKDLKDLGLLDNGNLNYDKLAALRMPLQLSGGFTNKVLRDAEQKYGKSSDIFKLFEAVSLKEKDIIAIRENLLNSYIRKQALKDIKTIRDKIDSTSKRIDELVDKGTLTPKEQEEFDNLYNEFQNNYDKWQSKIDSDVKTYHELGGISELDPKTNPNLVGWIEGEKAIQDEYDKQLETKEEEYADLQNEAKTNELFEAAWRTNIWQTLSTMATAGRFTNLVNKLLKVEWWDSWRETMQDIMESLGYVANLENTFCESALTGSNNPSSPIVNVGYNEYRSGSYIGGVKYRLTGLNGAVTYNYIISGGVNPKGDGLKFKVYLDAVDITSSVPPDYKPIVEVTSGGVLFSGVNSIKYNATSEYQRVCIEFLNSDIHTYFDDVSSLEGKKQCQAITVE